MIARVSTYANVDLDLADRLKAWMDGAGAGRSTACPATAAR